MAFRDFLADWGIISSDTEVLINGVFCRKQATPETSVGTVTLTVAQMLSGILVATPTAAAAYTLPLGSDMDDALTAYMINDTSFDLAIINLSVTAADIITLTQNTGFTIVGQAIVEAAENAAQYLSSGIFRCRKTATDTFVAYRIS